MSIAEFTVGLRRVGACHWLFRRVRLVSKWIILHRNVFGEEGTDSLLGVLGTGGYRYALDLGSMMAVAYMVMLVNVSAKVAALALVLEFVLLVVIFVHAGCRLLAHGQI
jgi:hypothetical protein